MTVSALERKKTRRWELREERERSQGPRPEGLKDGGAVLREHRQGG